MKIIKSAAFKNIVEVSLKNAQFLYIKRKQGAHNKIKHVQYFKFVMHRYLTSPLISFEEALKLSNLRADSVRIQNLLQFRVQ